jgi:hypothetical protein
MSIPVLRRRHGFIEYAEGQRGHLGALGLHSSISQAPWKATWPLAFGEKKGIIPGLRVLPIPVKRMSSTETGTTVFEIFPTIPLRLT